MIQLGDTGDTVIVECSECGNEEEIPKMMLRELEGVSLDDF